jgi:cation diffusion facilitator family transporter
MSNGLVQEQSAPITRYSLIKKAMFVAVFVNFTLGFIKVLFGVIGNSSALISDGVHSLADLFADFFTLIAGKLGSKAPDEDHPYGHKRIETFFNFWLGIILIAIAIFIAWGAVSSISQRKFITPDKITLFIALLSVLSNEGLYRFLKRLNKKHNIPIILTNAYHARADVYSSVIVFIGILGSLLGISWFDGVATIIVAGFIAKMGIDSTWGCVKELTDTAVSNKMLKQIESILENISDIKDFYNIRTRSMAESVFLDVHILVSDYISVSEGHLIAEQARYNLIQNIESLEDVVIHIDYCKHDDESIFLYSPDKPQLSRNNLLKFISAELGFKLESKDLIIDYLHQDNNQELKLNLKLLLNNKYKLNKQNIERSLKNSIEKSGISIGSIGVYILNEA